MHKNEQSEKLFIHHHINNFFEVLLFCYIYINKQAPTTSTTSYRTHFWKKNSKIKEMQKVIRLDAIDMYINYFIYT